MGLARSTRFLTLIALAALLSACETTPPLRDDATRDAGANSQPKAPDAAELASLRNFYLPYAVLAADVYRTHGVAADRMQRVVESGLLKQAEAADAKRADDSSSTRPPLDPESVRALYRRAWSQKCSSAKDPQKAEAADGPGYDQDGAYMEIDEPPLVNGITCATVRNATEKSENRQLFNGGDEEFIDGMPRSLEDCGVRDDGKLVKTRVMVPVSDMAATYRWERIVGIEKYASLRSFWIFVPELAIEVWRRPQGDPAQPVDEYAVVFRGTAGKGGWFSDFRFLTGLLPFFWDQYRQAQRSVERIIDQITLLYVLREQIDKDDYANGRIKQIVPRPIPRVTLVGHSLGGALATYVYLHNPRVTRVVAFNPSPVDGSLLFLRAQQWQARRDAMTDLLPPADPVGDDRIDPGRAASIFVLVQRGEPLAALSPCVEGPVWGDEGGPFRRCHAVDFYRGHNTIPNRLRKHEMSRLACGLAYQPAATASAR